MRKAVEEFDIELDGNHIRVAISGGMAVHQRGDTLEDFMLRTEQYSYEAKEGGRNRNVSET